MELADVSCLDYSAVPGRLLEPNPEQHHEPVERWVRHAKMCLTKKNNRFPTKPKQSRAAVEYHTRVTPHEFDTKLWLLKLTSKTRAELEIDPTPETVLRSEKQSAGEVIKIWAHERIIQLPGLLQRRLKFAVSVCSHARARLTLLSPRFRLGNLLWSLHRWHRHLLAPEQRRPVGVPALSGDVLRCQIQHYE